MVRFRIPLDDPLLRARVLSDMLDILNVDVVLPKWTKPDLQSKPVITSQQIADFLQRKQECDAERKAKRSRVTLTAENYNSLDVSVLFLTIIGDLFEECAGGP
jgi:hypothetical protein